jgi:hypothetical protein
MSMRTNDMQHSGSALFSKNNKHITHLEVAGVNRQTHGVHAVVNVLLKKAVSQNNIERAFCRRGGDSRNYHFFGLAVSHTEKK